MPVSQARAEEIERDILTIFRERLGDPAVESADDYFERGGDSLSALHIVGELQSTLGVDVGIADLFRHPSARGLARYLALRTTDTSGAPGVQGPSDTLGVQGPSDSLGVQGPSDTLGVHGPSDIPGAPGPSGTPSTPATHGTSDSATPPQEKAHGECDPRLVELAHTVLGVTLGPDDDFFTAGGDSLAAVRLVSLARAAGLDLGVRQVIELRTPRQLSKALGPQGA